MEVTVVIEKLNRERDLVRLSGEAYHLRCDVDKEEQTIKLLVLNKLDQVQLITISNVSPLMGHAKTNECCN